MRAANACRASISREQKLYTYPNNKNAYKAIIAAEINKVKLELPQFEFGVTNKTDKFVKLNPFAKVRAGLRASGRFRRLRRPWLSRSVCEMSSANSQDSIAGSVACSLLSQFDRFRPSRRRRGGSSRATRSLATLPALGTTASSAPPRWRRYAARWSLPVAPLSRNSHLKNHY